MSCNCSPIKKSVEEAAIYSVSKVFTGNKDVKKEEMMTDFAIVLGTGLSYDYIIGPWLEEMSYDPMTRQMMKKWWKIFLQMGALSLYDISMSKKISMMDVLRDFIDLSAGVFGLQVLTKI